VENNMKGAIQRSNKERKAKEKKKSLKVKM
jgi:hypothetical protein